MSITFQQVGFAATVFCVSQVIPQAYGNVLFNAAAGLSLGLLMGFTLQRSKNLPTAIPHLMMLGATAVSSIELMKNALNSHHNNISGLSFLTGCLLGLLQSTDGNLGRLV